MRWNEHTLRRAETVIAVVVVALILRGLPRVQSAMTDGRSGWNPPAWRGYSERVGQWWRLTKGSRAVACDIWTHPLGGELRCEIDGEMFGTRASRNLTICSMRRTNGGRRLKRRAVSVSY